MSVIKTVPLPLAGHNAHFIHRDMMRNWHPLKKAARSQLSFSVPATTLPVDSTNNGACILPMDGNDSLGDCGEAMCCHAFNIWTYGQGKPGFTAVVFDESALESQYEKVSGGDNGLDEDEVVNQIMKVGVAGHSDMIITDALDFDVTNIPLTQYLIDQFYVVFMAWSVPDAFISAWQTTGTVWPSAMTPDPNNGHFVTLASVHTGKVNGTDVTGFYELDTWGGYGLAGPDFIASVQPQCFVSFSPRQFNLATGLDSKGRHIVTQAAAWVAIGGNPVPAAIISAFPPIGAPTPGPTPTPIPGPTPTPTPVTTITVPATALWLDKPSAQLHVPSTWKTGKNNFNPEVVIHPNNEIVDVPTGGSIKWNLV